MRSLLLLATMFRVAACSAASDDLSATLRQEIKSKLQEMESTSINDEVFFRYSERKSDPMNVAFLRIAGLNYSFAAALGGKLPPRVERDLQTGNRNWDSVRSIVRDSFHTVIDAMDHHQGRDRFKLPGGWLTLSEAVDWYLEELGKYWAKATKV